MGVFKKQKPLKIPSDSDTIASYNKAINDIRNNMSTQTIDPSQYAAPGTYGIPSSSHYSPFPFNTPYSPPMKYNDPSQSSYDHMSVMRLNEVFLVTRYSYDTDDTSTAGVFPSRELAEEYIDNLDAQLLDDDWDIIVMPVRWKAETLEELQVKAQQLQVKAQQSLQDAMKQMSFDPSGGYNT